MKCFEEDENDDGSVMWTSASPPMTIVIGDKWLNENNNKIYISTESGWISKDEFGNSSGIPYPEGTELSYE